MCTLLVNDQPTLVAWTADPSSDPEKKKRRRTKSKKSATPTAKKHRPVIISITRGEPSPQMSAEREPIRFDDHGWLYKGTRLLCSKFNRGRKAHDHIEHLRRVKSDIKRHPTYQ